MATTCWRSGTKASSTSITLLHGKGQLYDGRHGTDFAEILHITEIDFGGYHFYPQDWGHEQDLEFGDQWIKDHAKPAAGAGKPVSMEEYGLKIGDPWCPMPSAQCLV